MIQLLEGIACGWVLFTPTGKKVVNKIVNKSIKRVKKTLITPEMKNLLNYKDLFINDEEDDDEKIDEHKSE